MKAKPSALALPLALGFLVALGACSSTPPQANTPRIVTNMNELRPGTGVVQSVMTAPRFADAAAGGSQPMQRLEIRMDDGKIQYVDTNSREIQKGDRLQISADGMMRRV